MREDARISNLRVKAHGYRGVPMVQSVVEDALRTQLSCAGPTVQRGLLVIRRVDFGPITSRHDHAQVKRRLAAILREAARHARVPEAGEEVSQDAVLFPDPLAPACAVFAAIGQGRPIPRSWPYRAALGEVVFAHPCQIVETLITRQFEVAQTGPALRRLLLALGQALPKRLDALAPGLPTAALRVLTVPVASEDGQEAALGETERIQLARDLDHLVRSHGVAPIARGWLSDRDMRANVFSVLIALAIGNDRQAVPAKRVANVVSVLGRIHSQHTAQASSQAELSILLQAIASELRTSIRRRTSEGVRSDPGEFAEIVEGVLRQDREAMGLSKAKPEARITDISRAKAHEASFAEEAEPPMTAHTPTAHSGFAPTRFAGLAYAIVLVDRIFANWINTPEHLAQGTGRALLRRIVSRLGPHPEDPTWIFLDQGENDAIKDASPLVFALRAEMLPTSHAPVLISRVREHRGWRMATLRGVMIAVWKGRADAEVRQTLSSARRIARTPPRDFSMSDLLNACELGLRRVLRSAAGLRLADLVSRSGGFAPTATHLDFCFDASVIDLAVRRAALDVSPGWCPWLWRVVTIHYDFGDAHAA